jgi:hypothetical protein
MSRTMSCAVNVEEEPRVEVSQTTEQATPLDASQPIADTADTKISSTDTEESIDDAPLCRQLSE